MATQIAGSSVKGVQGTSAVPVQRNYARRGSHPRGKDSLASFVQAAFEFAGAGLPSPADGTLALDAHVHTELVRSATSQTGVTAGPSAQTASIDFGLGR